MTETLDLEALQRSVQSGEMADEQKAEMRREIVAEMERIRLQRAELGRKVQRLEWTLDVLDYGRPTLN